MLYDTKKKDYAVAIEVLEDLIKNSKSPANKRKLADYAEKYPVNKYYKLFAHLAKFSDEELMDFEDGYYKRISNKKLNEKEKVQYELKYLEKVLEERFTDEYKDIDLENMQILYNMELNINNNDLTIKDIDKMKRTLISLETDYNLSVSFLTTFVDMYYDKLVNKYVDNIKKHIKYEKPVELKNSLFEEIHEKDNKKVRGR